MTVLALDEDEDENMDEKTDGPNMPPEQQVFAVPSSLGSTQISGLAKELAPMVASIVARELRKALRDGLGQPVGKAS
jgi:hypothetical protein